MSGHLVHLAGPSVRAGDVIRQRCVWCGALIDEMDLARVAVPEGDTGFVGDDGTPLTRWAGFVAVEQHGEREALGIVGKWAVDAPADGKIPEDSCMALPAEATA